MTMWRGVSAPRSNLPLPNAAVSLMSGSMEEEIQKLQMALAHQQEDISRLSEELYTQQQEIAELRLLLKTTQTQFAQAVAELGADGGKEPPPPHY